MRTLVVLGATARLTRFIMTDQLGGWLVRDRIDERMERYAQTHSVEPWWWKYRSGLECPFCVGFWVALAVVAGESVLGGRSRLWRVVTAALAVNYVTGHVSARLDGEEED